MDVLVRLTDVADAEFAAGLRHYLHQTNRTDGADGALVKTRFLITLRHQHQGIEPVFAGVVPENLYRVAKALQVGVLGGGVQLLELRQVGPRLIRPPIHIPSDVGNSAIYPAKPLVSFRTYRQLSGWNAPPLMIRA